MGVKIAVIGGGSTYTPELVDGFARRGSRLPIDELVLHDIAADRLEIVGGLARRMLAKMGWGGRLVLTGDPEAAVDGAEFVLIQLRVGGQAARLVDETLPPTFGSVGQETTGAGGFAKALRTVPVVLELAELVGRRSAPGAWIVDFTNPVGIVTQALLDAGHRAIGLCNVAINMQRVLAERLEVAPNDLTIEHVGLNHLSWVRAARVDGVDRLPDLLARDAAWAADHVGLPADRIRSLGAIPSYYLRYYYAHDEVLAAQRNGEVPRAQEVAEIERELLELYKDPRTTSKPKLLEQRGGAFYSEAASRLVRSLHSGDGATHVVDIRNHGTLAGLADDDVVEVPARVDRDGAHPLPQTPLAPELLGLVQHVAAYERLAARGEVRKALLAHPLVGQWAKVEALT